MTTPTSFPHPSLPFLSPTAIKMSKAYYSYCQGNDLLFQIWRGVTYNFHDHSCCSLERNATQWLVCYHTRTDSIINGPTSSYYFYFMLYLSHRSSCHSLRAAILNNMAFTHTHTHSVRTHTAYTHTDTQRNRS